MRKAFSMESPWGADLVTIAESIASCRLGKKMGKCRDEDCKSCGVRLELEACAGQLSACDSLRVRQMARDFYAAKAFQHGADRMTFKEAVREAGSVVFWLVACALAAFGVGILGWGVVALVVRMAGGL